MEKQKLNFGFAIYMYRHSSVRPEVLMAASGPAYPPDWHWQTTAPKKYYTLFSCEISYTIFFFHFSVRCCHFNFVEMHHRSESGSSARYIKRNFYIFCTFGWWLVIYYQYSVSGEWLYIFLFGLLAVAVVVVVYYLASFALRVASDLFSLWMCRNVVTPMSESKDARRFFYRFSF